MPNLQSTDLPSVGAGEIRHWLLASTEILLRRLPALDYMLEQDLSEMEQQGDGRQLCDLKTIAATKCCEATRV